MPEKTPLYDIHVSLGARMVDFAGWDMPVQYTGVIDEHTAVRTACGLFDVSHMGEIEVSGPGALEAVKRLATNNVERVVDGQCQYTILCYDDGGTVDDTIVYRYGADRFLFCVNASNTAKAFEWISSRICAPDVLVEDVSKEYAQLALQGPASAMVIAPLLDIAPPDIKPFHFVMAQVAGREAMVSRTGYTGEDGFEIYLAPDDAVAVWEAVMEAGRSYGIKPIGLGARDTLRLEMGYPLYGHELSEKISPIEAGLKKYVRFDNRGFIGEEALKAQHEGGVDRTLVGLRMVDPGVPRAGYAVTHNGEAAGVVTSGTSSPSLKTGIAMALVRPALKEPGTGIEVVIRTRSARAEVVHTPFYVKKKLETAV
ncbi:MAG: glycine cleavage system aminomethyltransferase GcvT [Thermodesulfobacteriota bacterium]